jgi:hypothetical protein
MYMNMSDFLTLKLHTNKTEGTINNENSSYSMGVKLAIVKWSLYFCV